MAQSIARRHEAIRRAVTPLPGSVAYDNFKQVNVPESCEGGTLLEALCAVVKHLPAQYWEEECKRGLVITHDHKPVVADQIVRGGERYLHKFPNITEPDVNGDVKILHEDEALIVLNKSAPLPMHAGGRFHRNTLQHILNEVYHPQKPHPAHRLDANTTGVVLVTRTRHFAGKLQPQFARGEVRKTYLVRVKGTPTQDEFDCDAPISAESGEFGSRTVTEDGLKSRTEFRVLRRNDNGTTLLEARPLTGRTNQIRIHCAHLGFPIVGDNSYLGGDRLGTMQTLPMGSPPLCLHAWRVKCVHPLTRQTVEFTAPPPDWAGEVQSK
jgi:RluA family pseudouridine synthase